MVHASPHQQNVENVALTSAACGETLVVSPAFDFFP
jgi:hypothetical protein